MMHFTIDARDNAPAGVGQNGCEVCCCQSVHVRPGETNQLTLNYAPWVLPFMGRGMGCSPQIALEQLETCTVASGAPAPIESPIVFPVPVPTGEIAGDLKTKFTGDPTTFKYLPLYGPDYGTLKLQSDGLFDYKAAIDNGIDQFYFSVSNGTSNPVTYEAFLAIGGATAPTVETPHVSVPMKAVTANPNLFLVQIPIEVSPAAQPCEVWRMTVRQNAFDCNWNCFWHVSCWDIRVGTC